jgi:hypothetical protein
MSAGGRNFFQTLLILVREENSRLENELLGFLRENPNRAKMLHSERKGSESEGAYMRTIVEFLCRICTFDINRKLSNQRKHFIYDVVKIMWDSNLEVYPSFYVFQIACEFGITELVELCLDRKGSFYLEEERNSPILDPTEEGSKFALYYAFRSFDENICKLLFEHGWSLDKPILLSDEFNGDFHFSNLRELLGFEYEVNLDYFYGITDTYDNLYSTSFIKEPAN